ncbi:polysaccharide deacetylase family protein [Robertmurraya andreesenii]|uniref:Peptidoglycan/xylan/chitin deacetylase (PgdA/CDA1 family) n=1 Tax=Anoxybacillus andreesenii TaxID=1325932 RepID=A0ABT9V2P2_9BACL|nr:polysaccharide deacetylase family protein [Robertmurraya andreesenii]MDQ0155130.1 peptidoglycan/xylan/chitin deacetylase (PgdA/CDA1 family) [Robertmurraya andreesenii]
MLSRKRITIFILLISLTIIIFSSSTIFAKLIELEAKAEGKNHTIETQFREHATKGSEIELLEGFEQLPERFAKVESKMELFLTFDDGPTPFTPAILSVLRKYNIKSTFFMLNGNILKNPDIVKAVAEEGHSIGCHGVSHKVSAFYRTSTSPREEMETCGKSVEEMTGQVVQLIRVPFGSSPHLTASQKKELDQAHFIMWDWNVDSADWRMHSSEQMVQSVLMQVNRIKEKGIKPVILFHDKEVTAQVLPKIIEKLMEMGYEFKAISNDDAPMQFKIRT